MIAPMETGLATASLEVGLDPKGLRGTLIAANGQRFEFSGWIEFAGAIELVRGAASTGKRQADQAVTNPGHRWPGFASRQRR
jgi:hypothetical protein